MLQYKKINVSKQIDTNNTGASKNKMICYYWCLKDVGFKFQSHVFNKSHDVLMAAYELKNIRRLNVKSVIDLDVFYGISVEMRL